MDPVSLAAIGTSIAAAAPTVTAAASVAGAATSFLATNAQAKADKQRAEVEGQWAERRALEERAGAQRSAADEKRKAEFAQSRLGAVAGASGSGVSDGGVMGLFQGIEREGSYNAAAAQAGGEQKAGGISYQAALDRWSADANSRIKKTAAVGTLIGNLGSAAGQYGEMRTRMGMKYSSGGSTGTGYSR